MSQQRIPSNNYKLSAKNEKKNMENWRALGWGGGGICWVSEVHAHPQTISRFMFFFFFVVQRGIWRLVLFDDKMALVGPIQITNGSDRDLLTNLLFVSEFAN